MIARGWSLVAVRKGGAINSLSTIDVERPDLSTLNRRAGVRENGYLALAKRLAFARQNATEIRSAWLDDSHCFPSKKKEVVHICPQAFSTRVERSLTARKCALSALIHIRPHMLSTVMTTTYGKLRYCVSIPAFLGCRPLA